jgi:hypothetical protein
MKRKILFILIVCTLIILLCAGCAQKKGYIMRDDITYKDLDFVNSGTEPNLEITISDMYRVMGLPNRKVTPADVDTSGMWHYYYYFDDEKFKLGVIEFIFDRQLKIAGVNISSSPVVYDTEPFDEEPYIIDKDKYMMEIRHDIEEDELSSLDMEATSVEIQKILGAPRDRISAQEAGLRTDAYTYPLTNGNTFCISYQRNGVIVKAWVINNEGETREIFIDRTDEFGVWGK